MRTTARVRAVLATGLASAALLTACSGDDASSDASDTAPRSSAAGSSATEEALPDLASGLLPADAFGPEATVVAVSLAQLQQGAGLAASGAEGLEITPPECATAVEGTQPQLDDFEDVAAQSATTGSSATVEVLVRGGPIEDSVALLAEAAQRCPQAQITSPQIGQATVTFEALPVADLGDGSAMLRYTTAVALPDGTSVTVPALIGAVEDGDRLLILMNLQPSGPGVPGGPATDPAAFADLLEQAYETQAEALG